MPTKSSIAEPREMAKPTHTPGPWQIGVADPNGLLIDPGIGKVFGFGGCPQANASLICAAPDLLKIAKAAFHALKSYQNGNGSPDLAAVVAAALDLTIAKAEGGAL